MGGLRNDGAVLKTEIPKEKGYFASLFTVSRKWREAKLDLRRNCGWLKEGTGRETMGDTDELAYI